MIVGGIINTASVNYGSKLHIVALTYALNMQELINL